MYIGKDHIRIVRDVYICKFCDGIYADEPVTECDCMEAPDRSPNNFYKSKIEYTKPKQNERLEKRI